MHRRGLEVLKKFKERVPAGIKVHIVEIRCFGSYAKGEEKEDSDYDFLRNINSLLYQNLQKEGVVV